MYQNKKWFTDVVRTMNQINELESKQCKHECKCETTNKDFMTTLKSLYNKVDSDCYDMEMLADFIIDCEEMLNNPKKKIQVTLKINNKAIVIKNETFKQIADEIKNINLPDNAIYILEWNDDGYHYTKSNDIKMIYSILDSLD